MSNPSKTSTSTWWTQNSQIDSSLVLGPYRFSLAWVIRLAMVMRTPLHELESARGGRFREYHDWAIAEPYGEPRQEKGAVRGDGGIVALSPAAKVRLADRDGALC